MNRQKRYAGKILKNANAASPQIVEVCKRFLRWCDDDKFEFREKEVEKAVRFFSYLQHTKGLVAGSSFELLPWQEFAVANVYGWYYIGEGDKRVTRNAFFSVGRKNGKSTFIAGCALKGLLADNEMSPVVICVATSRDQAKIVFREASEMLRGTPELYDLVSVYRSQLQVPKNSGTFFAASADAARLWGYSVSCGIVDELHAHKDRRLYDALATSMVARKNPLFFVTTTAGDDESQLFSGHRTAALQLDQDEKLERLFAMDFFVPNDDDWENPEVWVKANPSLGYAFELEELENTYNLAKTPSAQVTFRRYHLNQLVANSEGWIPVQVWQQCEVAEEPDLADAPCYIGMDLASTRDLSAVVAVFNLGDQQFFAKPWAFTSEYAVTNGPRKQLYSRLAANGELIVTDGDTISEEIIARTVRDIVAKYRVHQIFYDRALSHGIIQRVIEGGVDEGLLVAYPMTAKAIEPMLAETERRIYNKQLLHTKNEAFEFCLANTVVETTQYGNRRISKKKSTGPIDLSVALILAAGQASVNSTAREETGIVWL
ncbi:MAG: terminase large subunit, partial [Planctomycetota bacterium]